MSSRFTLVLGMPLLFWAGILANAFYGLGAWLAEPAASVANVLAMALTAVAFVEMGRFVLYELRHRNTA